MPENCSKKPVFKVKIAYLWVEFSPRRRQVGQNLMRRLGKEIFRTFRISNQIFHSIYGSRDIERSLDTTMAVFGENLNFMDLFMDLYGSRERKFILTCGFLQMLRIDLLYHLTLNGQNR